ncbi:MAG: class I SAM-dependent methyltransferase [Heliobacteriaceae bacterium]|nr:class I SAM-dependent methyltransferase [Heliobacteriaceae bacterium]
MMQQPRLPFSADGVFLILAYRRESRMVLSPRLARLAAAVPLGRPVADIGTDHAYLPVYLVREGMVPFAVAGDLHPGPLAAARQYVAAAGAGEQVRVRAGDGLTVVRPGEVKTVIVAGMGGATIERILREGQAQGKLAGVGRLILQPLGGAGRLRRWLTGNGWRLAEEDLVAEGKRIYSVAIAEPGAMEAPVLPPLAPELIWELGPLLLQKRHPLLAGVAGRLLAREKSALAGMRQARQEAPDVLAAKMARVADLERVIAWLSSVHKS